MKILFVVPRYHTNMIGWVKAFINHGDEVLIHTMQRGGTENYDLVTPVFFQNSCFSKFIIKIFGEGGPNSPRSFPSLINYFFLIKRINPDVLVVRDITRLFSLLAALCAKILGIKVVIYSQMPLYSSYSLKRKKIINFINSFFNSFWMTPVLGNQKKSKNLPKKVAFIPFVGDICYNDKKIQDPISILMIGKFVERKNHLPLAKVMLDLKDKGYKFHLTMVGENSSEIHSNKKNQIMNFITTYNLHNEITLLENIPNESIGKLYSNANLFILPASNEPASVSVIEAMGYGLPVICADTCGTSCYITNNKNGYIFQDSNFDDLKFCIEKYLISKNKDKMKSDCFEEAKKVISANNFIGLFKEEVSNINNIERK